MKKILSILLTVALILASSLPAYAADTQENNMAKLMSAMGVMNGGSNGDFRLSANVTRAELSKMVVNASTYRNTVSPVSNSSPFKDVPYTHWAASYIKTAAVAGYMTGYYDGTFKPDRNVTIEEAASTALKMLGYTSSDFSGSFPYGQMAQYSALGLDKNISAQMGSYITRKDAMNLIYNLLNADTKSGVSYASSIGYKTNPDGTIDYAQIVSSNTTGPVTATSGWLSLIGMSGKNSKIYKNGVSATTSDVFVNDILYYSKNMSTVWAYSNRVTGIYEKASPSKENLTSVTVSGNSYGIETVSAFVALSSFGGFEYGDTVTLLLGRDGKVADVIIPDTGSTNCGVVVGTGTKAYTDSAGNSYSSNYITVCLPSGDVMEYKVDGNWYSGGELVKISFSNGKAVVTTLNKRTGPSGYFDAKNHLFGNSINNKLASDVYVMDVYEKSCVTVSTTRLDKVTIDREKVLYYETNSKNEISVLILDDVTGDMMEYGLITSVEENRGGSSVSSAYGYIVNGTSGTYSPSKAILNLKTGAGALYMQGGKISALKQITRVSESISNVSDSLITTVSGKSYNVTSDVSVYVQKGNTYMQSSLPLIQDKSQYSSYAVYYDKPAEQGGKIRVIVAMQS